MPGWSCITDDSVPPAGTKVLAVVCVRLSSVAHRGAHRAVQGFPDLTGAHEYHGLERRIPAGIHDAPLIRRSNEA